VNYFIKPLLLSASLSALLTIPTIWLARKLGLVDDPVRRPKTPARVHQGSIPRGGGLAIFLSIFVCSLLFLDLSKKLAGILAGAALVVLVGLLDDRFDLNPRLRLASNFIAAALVIGSGVGIPYVTNPFGGVIHFDQPQTCFNWQGTHCVWLLADSLALIFIPWMMNMVNWSKGVPGQMPGFAAITAIITSVVAYHFAVGDANQWPQVILSSIIAGAFLGFLPFNFHPQKIMPGYGGGTLAGFLLSVLAILSFNKVATVLLVLWIPMVDALFVLSRRIVLGRSPFLGDRSHLHHLLLARGWSFRKISLFYWIISAILGVLALTLDARSKFLVALTVGLVTLGLLIWLRISTTWPGLSDPAKLLKT
jgi:UDP-GlcNAc:undecaprenyl-phosphate GlcNAc-1-phosphate transferase